MDETLANIIPVGGTVIVAIIGLLATRRSGKAQEQSSVVDSAIKVATMLQEHADRVKAQSDGMEKRLTEIEAELAEQSERTGKLEQLFNSAVSYIKLLLARWPDDESVPAVPGDLRHIIEKEIR